MKRHPQPEQPSQAATRPRVGGRSARVVHSVLEATLEELGRVGYVALTFEGVAARAQVNRTTIYRRWPNVWALVMDAFLSEVTRAAPIREKATARESFAASMKLLARAYRGQQGKIMQPLLGRAQVDERLRLADDV